MAEGECGDNLGFEAKHLKIQVQESDPAFLFHNNSKVKMVCETASRYMEPHLNTEAEIILKIW